MEPWVVKATAIKTVWNLPKDRHMEGFLAFWLRLSVKPDIWTTGKYRGRNNPTYI